MSMDSRIREEARLVILRILYAQPDNRLTSTLIRDELDQVWGINRARAWVHEELAYLADLGAVKVTPQGTVQIAELLAKGSDHVERRAVITGVKRPSLSEA